MFGVKWTNPISLGFPHSDSHTIKQKIILYSSKHKRNGLRLSFDLSYCAKSSLAPTCNEI